MIIDKVSFLCIHNLMKLDKHLQTLKENSELFGSNLIIFVGDFSKMLPVWEVHKLGAVTKIFSLQ